MFNLEVQTHFETKPLQTGFGDKESVDKWVKAQELLLEIVIDDKRFGEDDFNVPGLLINEGCNIIAVDAKTGERWNIVDTWEPML